MADLQRLRRWSQFLHVVTCLGMVGLVGAFAFICVFAPPSAETMQVEYPNINVAPVLSAGVVRGMLLVTAAFILVWLFILNHMRRLFQCFASGHVLTDIVALNIRRIGWGLLGVSALQVLMVPVTSLLLTWDNPEGEHSLSIALNSDMIGFALAAGLMIVIGWAMREAAAIRAENQAFI